MQLAHIFEPLYMRHAITTRANVRNDLVVPRIRTVFGARAISVVGPVTWNVIPDDVRNANTLDTFKARYLRQIRQ